MQTAAVIKQISLIIIISTKIAYKVQYRNWVRVRHWRDFTNFCAFWVTDGNPLTVSDGWAKNSGFGPPTRISRFQARWHLQEIVSSARPALSNFVSVPPTFSNVAPWKSQKVSEIHLKNMADGGQNNWERWWRPCWEGSVFSLGGWGWGPRGAFRGGERWRFFFNFFLSSQIFCNWKFKKIIRICF